jgi:hypothetical protein
MDGWEFLDKFFTIPEDTRVIRHYKDTEGKEVCEIIPASALREYNQLLENMQRTGMKDVSQVKRIAER